MSRPRLRTLFGVLCLAIAPAAWSQVPFADVHAHFNWDQKEIISAEEIVAKLEAAGIAFSVVTSTPTELALEFGTGNAEFKGIEHGA